MAMNERQQSVKVTSAERDGYALLDRLGVDYMRQVTFAGKFIPDAVVPSARLVVQFDGDYWHGRNGSNTEARIVRRVALDKSQDAYVRACGWDVVRLWASDLRDDPEGCMAAISQGLHRPLGVQPSLDPLARA
jgi:very-short-patch-repair endonuclease